MRTRMRALPFTACVLLIAAFVAGCKSDNDKQIAADFIRAELAAIANTVHSIPSTPPQMADLKARCGEVAAIRATSEDCHGIVAKIVDPADTKRLTQHLSEGKTQRLSTAIRAEAAIQRGAAAAGVAVIYLELDAIDRRLAAFDAAVAASLGNKATLNAVRPSIALLEDGDAAAIAGRLNQVLALLAIVRASDPPLVQETSARGAAFREALTAARAPGIDRAALRTKIINDANNDRLLKAVPPEPDLASAAVRQAVLQTPAATSAFRTALAEIDALSAARTTASAPWREPIRGWTEPAAASFLSDCTNLLLLDENEFDGVCGPLHGTLVTALNWRDGASSGGASDGSIGPKPSPGPLSPDTVLRELKQRLIERRTSEFSRGGTIVALVAPVTISANNAADRVLIAALSDRIRIAARDYAEGSYQGHLERMVRAEVHLEAIYSVLSADRDALGPRLADPLALLEPEALAAGRNEWLRETAVLSESLAYFPGDPLISLARADAARRVARIDTLLAAPLLAGDLTAIVDRMDGKDLKALLTDNTPLLEREVERRMHEAKQALGILPARLDRWRGPRGPPLDPNFPRSDRIVAAFEGLLDNPTNFVGEMARLRAEHNAFYEVVGAMPPKIAALWAFGVDNHRAFLVSQLCSADLARLRAFARSIRPGPGPAADAPIWDRLLAELATLGNEIDKELARRHRPDKKAILPGTASGHPPGYPPGHPPELTEAARPWQRPAAELVAEPGVAEMHARTALEIYRDPELMPRAVADALGRDMAEVADRQLAALDGIADNIVERNDKAALAIEAQDREVLLALASAKQEAGNAIDSLAERVALLERSRLIAVDAGRWKRVRALSLRLGRLPPPADPEAIRLPGQPPPAGGGGARALVLRELAIDARISRAARALERARTMVSRTLPLAAAATVPESIGGVPGRAVASRNLTQTDTFVADLQRVPDAPRYPDGLKDWRGFFDDDGRPFNFDKSVRNFNNFNGVGGGIHFGSTATPDATTINLLADGCTISYDPAERAIKLLLLSGERFNYGPIEAKVLKALYRYVTTQPGINLAITIGATGAAAVRFDDGQTPVLLDPAFVDNGVGQALYLADTIPWSLNKPTMPDGVTANPIAASFTAAQAEGERDVKAANEKIATLLAGTMPLLAMSQQQRIDVIPSKLRREPLAIAAFISDDTSAFVAAYRNLALRELDQNLIDGPNFKRQQDVLTKVLAPYRNQGLPDWMIETKIKAEYRELVRAFLRSSAKGDDVIFLDALFPPSKRHALIAEKTAKFENITVEEINAIRSQVLTASETRSRSEIRVPGVTLRFRAATIKQIAPTASDQAIAASLLQAYGARGLAVLFDDSASFRLVDYKLLPSAAMRYRYARSDYDVVDGDLVIMQDGADKPSVRARHIEPLSDLVTSNYERLAAVYAPLAAVREYAALTAFLRWAACPPSDAQGAPGAAATCIPRPGVTIDFSALGSVALRDRAATPTPDADVH